MKICKKCSFKNDNTMKFCGNCGTKLENGDILEEENKKVSISATSFSIYALKRLRSNISGINNFQFLFKNPEIIDANKCLKVDEIRNMTGTTKENSLKFDLDQKKIAKEAAKWLTDNGSFKVIPKNCDCKDSICINNDSYEIENFTEDKIESFEDYKRTSTASKIIIDNFRTIWNDSKSKDVKQQVINYLNFASQDFSSQDVYTYTLFKIFNTTISEKSLTSELFDSVIWNKLFSFQKDATREIIDKLDKNKVCILADSVGLGKTFTAISVIKYYMRNNRVLVLCPKKLEKNWTLYNDLDILANPLKVDKLNYRVQAHTDLNRDSNNLNNIDWGSFGLVVIDESHNFRNGVKNSKKKSNRYTFLRDKIMMDGADTKLLMLSATPVNNDFLDLKNQISLAYAKNPAQMDEKKYDGKSINDIFNQAESVYKNWSKQKGIDHTTQQLVDKLDPEFFDMLDDLTIARSRKHINKYYNESIIFPKRLSPISITPELSVSNKTVSYQSIYEKLELLNLSIYTPSLFIKKDKIKNYETIDSNLTISGREVGILRLMLVNLMKRLESSITSFKITADKIRQKITQTINKINNFSFEDYLINNLGDYSEDFDDDDLTNAQDIAADKKQKIRFADMDLDSWKKDLESDLFILDSLLEKDIKSLGNTGDTKLDKLYEIIKDKQNCDKQINKGNKKIIIFTAFSNTAEYLYNNINVWAKKDYGLETALVTGSMIKCSIKELEVGNSIEKIDKILTYFSPKSKEKEKRYPADKKEIDILIATDCISEGQNLQDCDYLVNYDIHWNPVRIVQRFGRIDRIGSTNSEIQLVNFWPLSDLDAYLKLKTRVETRMKILNLAATGDDDLLNPEDDLDCETRCNQLKKMLNSKSDVNVLHNLLDNSPEAKKIGETLENDMSQLKSLQNEVKDYEDVSGGVSILDYGYNNYRAELYNALENNKTKEFLEKMPEAVYSVARADESCPPGAIIVLRNRNADTAKDRSNAFHPYYLTYITEDGCILCNYLKGKVILEKMRHLANKGCDMQLLYNSYYNETESGENTSKYMKLFEKSVDSIISAKKNADIASLSTRGKIMTNKNKIESKSDLDLVSYLIVVK